LPIWLYAVRKWPQTRFHLTCTISWNPWNVIPGKLGVDLHPHRVHIPLVNHCDRVASVQRMERRAITAERLVSSSYSVEAGIKQPPATVHVCRSIATTASETSLPINHTQLDSITNHLFITDPRGWNDKNATEMAADYGFPTDMETDVVGLEQDGILAEIKRIRRQLLFLNPVPTTTKSRSPASIFGNIISDTIFVKCARTNIYSVSPDAMERRMERTLRTSSVDPSQSLGRGRTRLPKNI